MVGPFVPDKGAGPSTGLAPVWAPSLKIFGEPMRSDATFSEQEGLGPTLPPL
jgi:hypothetical protein